MNWESMKIKLEHILNAPFRYENISSAEWNLRSKGHSSGSMDKDHSILFYLYKEGATVHTLAVEHVFLTSSERLLVEMMIDAYRNQEKKTAPSAKSEEENGAASIGQWLRQQLETGEYAENREMPERFATFSAVHSSKIPLLLYGDYSDNKKVTYQGLKKLLESFFDAEIVLIPLMEKEWLILASDSLLEAGDDEKESENGESLEDALSSLCYGLYEMMASEWVGECHLSVYYPIVPAKSILRTVTALREAIALGRTYHMGKNIHLPWLLQLDKLLSMIPEQEKDKFIDQVLKRNDYLLDSEMMQTLESFFELDCNVSETAKRLYIHRNTLLYRLDKFKQETGLDVRTFNHAVLVNIALQLYKVTKRK
jgi:sugar diacid utilization regulator